MLTHLFTSISYFCKNVRFYVETISNFYTINFHIYFWTFACCLLLNRQSGSSIIEFLISHNNGEFAIASTQMTTKLRFKTIQALLDHYKKKPLVDKQTDLEVKLCEVLFLSFLKKRFTTRFVCLYLSQLCRKW